tara:strand:+ start:775 stop:1293 length:519 start_codon:yes stop_codon:yes gene_type:complete
MKKQTFTQIPDEWGVKEFDMNSRFLVASILRWQTNGKQFHMKRKTFCESNGMPYQHFDKTLKKMIAIGIIVQENRLAKNIGVYKVDRHQLQKCLADTTNFKIKKCKPVTIEVKPCHFSSEAVSPLEVMACHHSITKQDTKEITKESIKVAQTLEDNFFDTIDLTDYKFKKTT